MGILDRFRSKPANVVAAKKELARPGGAHRELYTRPNLTGWNPKRVEAAGDMADGGNLTELADLVDTISRDDRVSGVMSTRTYGLLGLPVSFVGGSFEAREILQGTSEVDRQGEWYNMNDESELSKLLSWGIQLGVGLAQRIEQPRVLGQRHKYKLRTWHPRWMQYQHYPSSDGAHWHVLTQEGRIPIVAGDGEWILFTPYGENRPWAEGSWRATAFPWMIKRYALEDRANYSEVLGSPIVVGTTGKGSTEKQRRLWLSQLVALGKSGKIVIPDGWKLELLEATGKAFELYSETQQWADAAMTVVLAGQLVTTEGTSGFSSGNIFDAIKQDFVRFDAERLASCLHKQSLEQWAMINFGSSADAPWPQWQTKKPPNQDEQAKGLSSLGDAVAKLTASLAPYGYVPDVEKILSDYGVPAKKVEPKIEQEDVI